MLGLLLTLAVVIGVVYFLVTKYLKDRQDSSKTVSPRGCCCSTYLLAPGPETPPPIRRMHAACVVVVVTW